jgi:16S rRNA (adenine1518-N6/adenine1519-N6)-dimethyltransferase
VTLTRREAVELLRRHGIEPSKALGQNFVVDPNTVRRIVRLAEVGPGDRVVEIGAGLGALTLALAETGAVVTAVEVDRYLVPVLREVVAGSTVRVIEADALTVDWKQILNVDFDRSHWNNPLWKVVANLPYNVATPLVLDLLDHVPTIGSMLVMVQREVGHRLAAAPGGADYGIPSVKVAYHATAEVVGQVPATVFLPRPRVESVLVRIVRRRSPAVSTDPDELFSLVRIAFGQRRKMLRRSLAGLVSAEAFTRAGIAPDARPQELAIEEWGRLADARQSLQ